MSQSFVFTQSDGVPIEEWANEFSYHVWLSLNIDEAEAKASIKSANYQYDGKDPKLSELSMARVSLS